MHPLEHLVAPTMSPIAMTIGAKPFRTLGYASQQRSLGE
jgi:hypothetical protein